MFECSKFSLLECPKEDLVYEAAKTGVYAELILEYQQERFAVSVRITHVGRLSGNEYPMQIGGLIYNPKVEKEVSFIADYGPKLDANKHYGRVRLSDAELRIVLPANHSGVILRDARASGIKGETLRGGESGIKPKSRRSS